MRERNYSGISGAMEDSPFIPAFPPVAIVSVSAPQFTFTKALVQQYPAELAKPEIPVIVEGRVISSNPKMQEICIQTKIGEVVIQSSANLPPDTEVSVRIYTDKNRTLADIAVLRQTVVPSPQPEKLVPPLLPLLEGQTVTAFLLPEEPHTQIETQKQSGTLLKNPELSFRGNVTTEESPLFLREEKILAQPAHAKTGLGITKKGVFQQNHNPNPNPNTDTNPNPHLLPQAEEGMSQPVDNLKDNFDVILSATKNLPLLKRDTFGENRSFSISDIHEIPAYAGRTERVVFQAESSVPKDMYQLNILKIFSPDMPPEKIEIALQKTETPTPMLAKVEMVTSNRSPILKTADSHFVIKTPVSVPVGSVVIFEAGIVTPEAGIKDISSFQSSGLPFSVHGDAWPDLREALQILLSSTSNMVQAFRNTLPTPTPRFVPTALFFLAALRLGSIDNWLGDNTLKFLRQVGKKELVERLGSDFGKLSSMSKETLADGWHSISMPLLYDDQLSQMQFYVRHQYDNKDGDKEDVAKPATRFILNLHLSRMGEMQLDGFVRKKDFDVILRTEEKLSFDMRQELMKCFSQGLDQVRMQGKISFQTRQQSWITVNLPQQAGVVL